MVVGSILLVLSATGLLVTGLLTGDELYYYLSIVTSALAALSLIAGVRQLAGRRVVDDDFDLGPRVAGRPAPYPPATGRARVPTQPVGGEAGVSAGGTPSDGATINVDPPDEPEVEAATARELMKVARLDAEVVVIDGRPRYHLIECMHLLGRAVERLPVAEAVSLGFTPCATCRPIPVLLSGAP